MDHCRKLERMYHQAPCNNFYQPEIPIQEGTAEISFAVKPDMMHAGGTLHGSVFFKALDDAGFFAAQSLVEDCFVLTASFHTYFLRPLGMGRIRAHGRVVSQSKRQIVAEAVAYNDQGKEIARGTGVFMKSKTPLTRQMGYD